MTIVDNDKEYILRNWSKIDSIQIAKTLGCSYSEILELALFYNVKSKSLVRNGSNWNETELAFLRNNSNKLTTGLASNILQRSRYAVYMKAKLLGLVDMIQSNK